MRGFADSRRACGSEGRPRKSHQRLRKKGQGGRGKKSAAEASEGPVGSYIHAGGKIGVLVESIAKSDFVARTNEFQQLCHDIAMHIAAPRPALCAARGSDAEDLEKEREIYSAQARATGNRTR